MRRRKREQQKIKKNIANEIEVELMPVGPISLHRPKNVDTLAQVIFS
jgi:hypothetical protein